MACLVELAKGDHTDDVAGECDYHCANDCQVRTSTPTRSASRMCPTSNVGTGRGLRLIVRLSGREHQAFRRPRPRFIWTE